MVCDWGGALQRVNDPYTLTQKNTSGCFYGTTTGNRDPSKNERIQFCKRSLEYQPTLHCKLTKVAQMTPQDIISHMGNGNEFMKIYQQSPVSYADQCKHKFLISLDGNTCRYDVWNYKTNSVTLKSRSHEMLWYYPFMRDNEHFIEFDQQDMNGLCTLINTYGHDEATCQRIAANANSFIQEYCKPIVHMQYTVALFESMACNK